MKKGWVTPFSFGFLLFCFVYAVMTIPCLYSSRTVSTTVFLARPVRSDTCVVLLVPLVRMSLIMRRTFSSVGWCFFGRPLSALCQSVAVEGVGLWRVPASICAIMSFSMVRVTTEKVAGTATGVVGGVAITTGEGSSTTTGEDITMGEGTETGEDITMGEGTETGEDD